jgi:hypothetical protein
MALADLGETATLDLVLGSGALSDGSIEMRLGLGNGVRRADRVLVPSAPARHRGGRRDHDLVWAWMGEGGGCSGHRRRQLARTSQFVAKQTHSVAVGDLNADTFADVVVGLSAAADVARDAERRLRRPADAGIEPMVPMPT